MAEALVFYPSPAIGHLVSMVELGKLILTHCPSISIHILVTNQAYDAGATTPYIASVSATVPSLTFHHLSAISLPPDYSTTSPNLETLALDLIRLNNPNIRQALESITREYSVKAFVMDFFCSVVQPIVRELRVPSFFFFTSGAGFLSFFLYWPILHEKYTENFKDLKLCLPVPGLPPLPAGDVAKPLLVRDDPCYVGLLNSAVQLRTSDGIIVNSFDKLEPRAIQAIVDGECIPGGSTPPLFCIGPLISSESRRGEDGHALPGFFSWLDAQPGGSVVFLCFGSLGVFSVEQLKAIATGLENSLQRFLWVVKNPDTTAKGDFDLRPLLPDGFLDRTDGRGMLVKSWVPQVEVLKHGSVGGFVTHCGWNSVLEAVSAGVPMIAWPLYAEQRHNRVMMVEEMGIALGVEESEGGFVAEEAVERVVKELMLSAGGLRDKMSCLKGEAGVAMREGGSSHVALSKFTRNVVGPGNVFN
ncbi:hypothetical protein MLD38_030412 [Melastoma candidum]|uniref:Uncharacterized protein n=1 Tax=Melastoma candidum TaxID=119954 RepID=A0ACB9ML43_9MYRT|nr:hypothetical protein MLD38_030412 [Melastoma candidum]